MKNSSDLLSKRDPQTLPPAAKLVYETIRGALKNNMPLSEEILDDEISVCAVIGALANVCRARSVPAVLWHTALSNYPLPYPSPHPDDLHYTSDVVIQVDDLFFSAGVLSYSDQLCGPLMYDSISDYQESVKCYFFHGKQGPIYEEHRVIEKSYASPGALREFEQSIVEPLSAYRRYALSEITSKTESRATPRPLKF